MALAVIVWEYCRDGIWLNFERPFSDMVEENFSKGYRGQLVIEDQTSPSKFYINLFEMTLIVVSTRDTSTYFIRRNVFTKESLPGKGIFWQWFCKKTQCWKDYHINVATYLEKISKSEKADRQVDLSLHFPNYNALVDTKAMTHQEKATGVYTSVQRVIVQPYMSKQVSLTPDQCSPMQTASSFNNMPQHAFNLPMQNYPSMPLNMSAGGATQSTGLSPQGFSGSPMPVHQGLRTPSVANQVPRDQPLVVPPNVGNRKRAYDASSMTTPFRYDMGYTNSNPGYYGFSVPQNLDTSQAPHCRMPGRAGENPSQIQLNPSQSFNLYMPNGGQSMPPLHAALRKTMSASGSRRKIRDGASSMPASSSSGRELRNIIKADNYTTTFESVSDQGFIISTICNSTEDCTICFDSLQEKSTYSQGNSSATDHPDVVYFKNCHHYFHKECLRAMYNAGMKNGSIQCPQCKTIYGTKRGNCPPGEMSYEFYNSSLPGYEGFGTIFIKYHVSGGIQGQEHPNPGKPYSTRGFPRCCYLPNNPDGQKVLRLLIKAWKRRLTFTVGCSVTTGESDTVVWNEIHHKTEERDLTGHGYPDPNYLKNVTEELAAHGVFENDED